MASHNYIIGFLKYYLPIQHPLNRTYPSIRHRIVIRISLFWIGKNVTLISNDHEPESYNKFMNSLLKITKLSPWQI